MICISFNTFYFFPSSLRFKPPRGDYSRQKKLSTRDRDNRKYTSAICCSQTTTKGILPNFKWSSIRLYNMHAFLRRLIWAAHFFGSETYFIWDCLSVCLVWLFGLSVIIVSKGGEFHFHAPIGVFVSPQIASCSYCKIYGLMHLTFSSIPQNVIDDRDVCICLCFANRIFNIG